MVSASIPVGERSPAIVAVNEFALNRTRNIFVHHPATLNPEAGGEFAERLSSLYSYFVEKITAACVLKSINELDDIIQIIKEIKEAWENMNYEGSKRYSQGINYNSDNQLISMEV